VRNSDIAKGKSAGYRIIYYVQLKDKIVLITMYSKSERSDIATEEIIEALDEEE
jgi:mRNA-degrading endonuclease RelE of RelBE toxin-antitoxin system